MFINAVLELLFYYIITFLVSWSLKMSSFVITAKISQGTFKYVSLTTGGGAESKTSFFMQKVVKWPSITSYSCENFKLSFAFRRSMWSASSMTGMGGWPAIPADRRQTKSPGVSACTPEPTPRDGHGGCEVLFCLYDWTKQPHARREWTEHS